jgi:hypothetical protein
MSQNEVKQHEIDYLVEMIDDAKAKNKITSLQADEIKYYLESRDSWYYVAQGLVSTLISEIQLLNSHTKFLKYEFSSLLKSEHHRTKKPNKNMKSLRLMLRREYKRQRIESHYRHSDSESSKDPYASSESEDSLAPSDRSSSDFYPPHLFKSNKKKNDKNDVKKSQKKQEKEGLKTNQKKEKVDGDRKKAASKRTKRTKTDR